MTLFARLNAGWAEVFGGDDFCGEVAVGVKRLVDFGVNNTGQG